jgi:hypothetical protein
MNAVSKTADTPLRALRGWPLAAVVVLLAVTGCSAGGSTSGSASNSAGRPAGDVAAPAGSGSLPRAGGVSSGERISATSSSTSDPTLVSRSLIKTGSVSLMSSNVSSVVARIDQLVARDGGFVASEDSSTDTHGSTVRSSLDVAVPQAGFQPAFGEISSFGTLVSRSSSTRDVTAQVVDVDSRVKSAQASIGQLRLLFNRATKLGDVIALENELSQREADLEALQAEQRDLRSQTTMSTISVDVRSSAATTAPGSHKAGGFLSGLRQGWDVLVAFLAGFTHLVGLVLPLGILALLAGAGSWLAVRRFTPRRPPRTSE